MEMSWDRDALRHRLVPGLDLHRVAGGALVADERTQAIRRPLGCVAEVTMVGRRWRRKCGLWAKSLLDDRNIVPTAREFATTIGEYYRNRPIIEALGFHVANEATAPLDFGVFLATFREYREQYGLKAQNDPHLNFLLVHDDVEVSHREMGVEAVQLYTGGNPALVAQARRGVKAYMECYGRFFAELNDAIFGQHTTRTRARA